MIQTSSDCLSLPQLGSPPLTLTIVSFFLFFAVVERVRRLVYLPFIFLLPEGWLVAMLDRLPGSNTSRPWLLAPLAIRRSRERAVSPTPISTGVLDAASPCPNPAGVLLARGRTLRRTDVFGVAMSVEEAVVYLTGRLYSVRESSMEKQSSHLDERNTPCLCSYPPSLRLYRVLVHPAEVGMPQMGRVRGPPRRKTGSKRGDSLSHELS